MEIHLSFKATSYFTLEEIIAIKVINDHTNMQCSLYNLVLYLNYHAGGFACLASQLQIAYTDFGVCWILFSQEKR